MERGELKELLGQVAMGAVPPDDTADCLGRAPVEELGHAALDMGRASRASRLCWLCSTRARAGSRCSTSTTALAPPIRRTSSITWDRVIDEALDV